MVTFISTPAEECLWRCPKINLHVCLPHASGWRKKKITLLLGLKFGNVWQSP